MTKISVPNRFLFSLIKQHVLFVDEIASKKPILKPFSIVRFVSCSGCRCLACLLYNYTYTLLSYFPHMAYLVLNTNVPINVYFKPLLPNLLFFIHYLRQCCLLFILY